MINTAITQIIAREILDSRGNPTIEVDVHLSDGSLGRAVVPSGASTGEHEAVELRDGDQNRFLGRGVLKAVQNVTQNIFPKIEGCDPFNQEALDDLLIELDGTENKSNLGANALLGVSMAVCRAAAVSQGISLYKYLIPKSNILPVPMMNILNGGSHADNNVDIQEFMVIPHGVNSFSEALRMGTETFHQLRKALKRRGLNTSVGDEGGFAPNLKSNEEAVEIIIEAIRDAGYKPGEEISIAIDVAASEFYSNGKYHLESEKRSLTSDEMVQYFSSLVEKYPIISIEDGLSENDWDGWKVLNDELGTKIQIVGDDLTVTNILRLQKAIDERSMNAILIKLNQIGTVSETIQAVDLARANNFGAVISHRSGETEDTFIADFSVAMGMGQIKTGSASRTDRICRYNQLLRIEEELGTSAEFLGKQILVQS